MIFVPPGAEGACDGSAEDKGRYSNLGCIRTTHLSVPAAPREPRSRQTSCSAPQAEELPGTAGEEEGAWDEGRGHWGGNRGFRWGLEGSGAGAA